MVVSGRDAGNLLSSKLAYPDLMVYVLFSGLNRSLVTSYQGRVSEPNGVN